MRTTLTARDIIAILDINGNSAVDYIYDAWGVYTAEYESTGMGIGKINPIRYRGYYYDVETGLFYVASRYYDPVVGRFINALRICSGCCW